MRDPEINATASAELLVSPTDLASALSLEPADSYPPVFSTSRMVALMEIAASRVLRPLLSHGEQSVGVSVDVAHTAATPPGVKVTATARYLGREGKLFVFEVVARDPGGGSGGGRTSARSSPPSACWRGRGGVTKAPDDAGCAKAHAQIKPRCVWCWRKEYARHRRVGPVLQKESEAKA